MNELVGGSSKVWNRTLAKIQKYAESECTVLICGETGVGKGLVARTIHHSSKRGKGPFRTVDMPCIDNDLFGSELFGHVKGAFTGALGNNNGLLHWADGGTIFFDEIGELSLANQARLLLFLERQEYRQLGSQTVRKANVRIVAATNRDQG